MGYMLSTEGSFCVAVDGICMGYMLSTEGSFCVAVDGIMYGLHAIYWR